MHKRLFVLVFVFIVLLCSCDNNSDVTKPTPTPHINISAEPSNSPTPLIQTESPTNAPVISTPVATATIEVIATPTITSSSSPISTPDPEGNITQQGFLRSDSGTNLNLRVDWIYQKNINNLTAKIAVEIYVESYSLFTSSKTNCKFYINETEYIFNSDEIRLPNNVAYDTIIAAYSQDIVLSSEGNANVTLTAKWPFTGTYAGVNFSAIEVIGIVII